MEKLMTNELSGYINQEIISFFIVQQKELREGKRDFFIRMRLGDKTGSVNANIWNNAKGLSDRFAEGDVVKIKGVVILYKDQVQVTVNNIKKADEIEYDLADFIATTSKDLNELTNQFYQMIDSVTNPYLKQLMEQVFGDKEFFSKFAIAPAAKSWHHNYRGGLIEHSVSVAMICENAASMYPINRDLVLCGALLHDAGKVYEYESRAAIDFTSQGRLIGHIVLGDEIIVKAAAAVNNFPQKLLMKLRHLILSHHGEYEKAAARLPQTIEAIVLHFADNLDAQTVGVKQLIEGMQSDGDWSEYDYLNNRYYFVGEDV